MACILSALLEEHGKKKTDKGQSAKQQPRRQLWCARRRKYEGAREGQIQTVESSFSSIKNNSVVKVCNKMQRIECGICGGVGKSRFDGIVCCDDCKGFFRRRVTMLDSLQSVSTNAWLLECRYTNTCDIGPHIRHKCTACLIKKCQSLRMIESFAKFSNTVNRITTSNSNISSNHTPTQVAGVSAYVVSCPSLSYEDLKNYTDFPLNFCLNNLASAQCLFEKADAFAVRIVEFAKKLPEFNVIKREDQVTLLRHSGLKIMLLRNADYAYEKRDRYLSNLRQSDFNCTITRRLTQFYGKVKRAKLDDTHIALFAQQLLYRPRMQRLHDPQLILDLYKKLQFRLHDYCISRRCSSEATSIVPDTLHAIEELAQELDGLDEYIMSVIRCRFDKSLLSPLVIDIWNYVDADSMTDSPRDGHNEALSKQLSSHNVTLNEPLFTPI